MINTKLKYLKKKGFYRKSDVHSEVQKETHIALVLYVLQQIGKWDFIKSNNQAMRFEDKGNLYFSEHVVLVSTFKYTFIRPPNENQVILLMDLLVFIS